MENEIVLYEKKERVALITINRPEVRNALNMGVFQALHGILDDAAKDQGIRAVVVTGSGTTFAAGADINELLSMDSAEGWTASKFSHSVLNRLERLGKPSIAAMNGPALGGGLELALACTLRFASSEAKMGFPELGLGIVPGFGGSQRLIRTVGPALAADLLLRRRMVGAEEAKALGLVSEVIARDQIVDAALSAARDLAALSPVAVSVTMELLQHTQSEGFDSGLAMEAGLACLTLSTPEARASLAAFLGKGKG